MRVLQRVSWSEVKGERFGVGRGSALQTPFIHMLMCKWVKTGHSAPENSFTRKCIPLRVQDSILRTEWANVIKQEIVRMSVRGTGDCMVSFEKTPFSQMRVQSAMLLRMVKRLPNVLAVGSVEDGS